MSEEKWTEVITPKKSFSVLNVKELLKYKDLIESNHFADNLVRLPIYFELRDEDITLIINAANDFYNSID